MKNFLSLFAFFLINVLYLSSSLLILPNLSDVWLVDLKSNHTIGLAEIPFFFGGDLVLILGLITLFLIFVSAVLLKENRKLKKKKEFLNKQIIKQEVLFKYIVEKEIKEREQIVHSLQDVIGQQLSAAKLNISALLSYSKTLNSADKIIVQKAIELTDNSVKEVRKTSNNIIPSTLIKSGLLAALHELIDFTGSRGGTQINLEIFGSVKRQPRSKEVTLFRILRELIENSLTHSLASEINVQLIKHENEFTILVQDNGVGFIYETEITTGKGTGLKSIQWWVTFFNGKVFFDSQPSKGTTVSIEIPEFD